MPFSPDRPANRTKPHSARRSGQTSSTFAYPGQERHRSLMGSLDSNWRWLLKGHIRYKICSLDPTIFNATDDAGSLSVFFSGSSILGNCLEGRWIIIAKEHLQSCKIRLS
jgi:hypothetical protein